MSEETPRVSIVKVAGIDEMVLPDTALDLWDRAELHDLLNLPHDGTKVEIIDGTIVVTTAPLFGRNFIATEIAEAVALAGTPETTWKAVQGSGVLFPDVGAAISRTSCWSIARSPARPINPERAGSRPTTSRGRSRSPRRATL